MINLSLQYKIVLFIFAIVWILIILKLFIITIKQSEHYEQVAKRNMFKQEVLVPARGLIYDRNQVPLAVNELLFSISLEPLLKDKDLQEAVEKIIENLQGQERDTLIQTYKRQNSAYNHDPIKVIEYVTYDEIQQAYAALIQEDNIYVYPVFRRFYPYNELASHIIGYVGVADKNDIFYNPISKYTQIIGKEGIEKQYNSILQGQLSYRNSVVNAYNQKISQDEEDKPQIQNNITLTIDAKLQKAIDEEYADRVGSVGVMNVKNGEILAAGSYPEYNLNDFSGGISVAKWNALTENVSTPLINRFVSGQYPPGSVIKMGVAMAILEYGGVDEYTKINTPAAIKIGDWYFRDWKPGGHGQSDVFKAIRESVDVYFYQLSQVVGIENMTKVLAQMGFGEKTGVDFPLESSGILPTPNWKAQRYGQLWYVGDTVQTSIGQGLFLATPMQIARYTSLLASGKLPTPHFYKNQEDLYEPEDVLNDFQKSKLWAIQKGMIEACNAPGGTGTRRVYGAKVKIACKTGTAQVVSIPQEIKKRLKESEMGYYQRSHAWMTGFVPAQNPQYAITILIEHGQSGGNAGPVMVRITNELYKLGYIKP